tara:strand:- start:190 stop:342 length:153 start_codon:yes stop_codon:yes gene_type:complete
LSQDARSSCFFTGLKKKEFFDVGTFKEEKRKNYCDGIWSEDGNQDHRNTQ